MGEAPFSIDVTIFKMVDGLHHPKSCIKEAQELLADAYGVKHSFFAVNGTSGAIQAMIMSVIKAGEKNTSTKKRTQISISWNYSKWI